MQIGFLYQKVSSNALEYLLFLSEQECELKEIKKSLEVQEQYFDEADYYSNNLEDDTYDEKPDFLEQERYLNYCQNPEYGDKSFDEWIDMKDDFVFSEENDIDYQDVQYDERRKDIESKIIEDFKSNQFIVPTDDHFDRIVKEDNRKLKVLKQRISLVEEDVKSRLLAIITNEIILDKKVRYKLITRFKLKQELCRELKLGELKKDLRMLSRELIREKLSDNSMNTVSDLGSITSLEINAKKLLLDWVQINTPEIEDTPA
ncbi:hypothetical protein BH11BAC7_BH11BAC7_05280 [soil metagenome]